MKAIGLFFFAVLVAFGLCSFSDGDDGTDSRKVSIAVLKAFEQKYPQAVSVDWDKEGKYYVVDFRALKEGVQSKGACEMEAWFDMDANWRMTVTDIGFDMLPQEVKDGFKACKFADWRVDDVHIVERNGKPAEYVIEVEKGRDERDLYFNIKGELVKELRDSDYKSLL